MGLKLTFSGVKQHVAVPQGFALSPVKSYTFGNDREISCPKKHPNFLHFWQSTG